MDENSAAIYRFDEFELNSTTGELRKGNTRLHLSPQPAKILELLVDRAGKLVTREEIRKQIWGDSTFVDFEQGLNFCIRQIRAALNDDHEKPRFVETLPRRGYRFIASVKSVHAPGETPKVASPPPGGPNSLTTRVIKWPHVWWALPVAVLGVATSAFIVTHRKGNLSPAQPAKMTLAVLPFQNLDGNSEDDYLSDGLTEEMITQLGSLEPGRLGVIARTTAMHYKNSSKTVQDISRELGIDYVLEGSVRRQGNRIRISTQFIEAHGQTHLWARDYDRELRDVLGVEAEVSQSVANAIQLRLTTVGNSRLANARKVDPEAFEAYLKGRYLWNSRTSSGLQESIAYFQKAIAKEPDYGLAYAGLADSYNILGNWGLLIPDQAYPQAKDAASRALAKDSSLPDAQVALAFARYLYDWDWSAEDGFRKAIQSNPGYGAAHQWYGVVLVSSGRYDEAIAEEELAQQADPYSLIIHAVKGWVYYLSHRYDLAITASRQALDLDPNFSPAHGYLGIAYEAKGMYPEAIREIEESAKASDRPFELAALAHAYGRAGRTKEARKLIADLRARAARGYFPAGFIALAYAGVGDRDASFEWLETAYRERFPWLIHLKADPRWDVLRDDPRFASLVSRVGLTH